MFGLALLAIFIALIAFMFYKISADNAQYFEKRKIKYLGVATTIKILFGMVMRKYDALELQRKIYGVFPNEPIFGAFDISVRQFHIRDPLMIKRISVKDFDHFQDHRKVITENMDEVLSKALIIMDGEDWHQMRTTLSPAFTGSKMRQMYGLISEYVDEMIEHFTKKAKSGEKLNVELGDFFSRCSSDVIATCAFGLKVNSFADPDNEFYLNGKKLFDFTGIRKAFKFVLILLFPKLAQTLNIKVFDQSVVKSFKNIILDTMITRQKMNIHRPDMINIMMQVREGKLTESIEEKTKCPVDGFATAEDPELKKANVARTWNDNEIVAQCLLFFIAGYLSISSALSMIGYELAINPDVQQKLCDEIDDMNKRLGGKVIDYDTLQKMKYLDQVISESLRKWPLSAAQSDRKCVKDYIYDDGQRKFKIEKGANVIFPIYLTHHNPKYYPDPEKFDPERFNDENKKNIVPGTYMPFSVGPRNCIGSRFALMEIKAVLYNLLLKFSFEVNKDTQIPLKLMKSIIAKPENGIHVELKLREKSA